VRPGAGGPPVPGGHVAGPVVTEVVNGDDHTGVVVHAAARRLRLTRLLWLGCVLSFGLAVVLTSLVVFNLVSELHDARQDIEENRVENTCRAEISARLEVIDSEISFQGWQALTAYVIHGDVAQAERRAAVIDDLAAERDVAAQARTDIVELCDNGP
jgi:hypothetical protein